MRAFHGNRATSLDIRDEYHLRLLTSDRDVHIRSEAARCDLVASMVEETVGIGTASCNRPGKLICTGIGDIECDPSLLCWKTRGEIDARGVDL